MHLTDLDLHALLDGELLEIHAGPIRVHLDACPACARKRSELERERQETAALLASLDHVAPRLDVEAVVARARGSKWRGRSALAAGLALLVVATAAAALPHSPVRQWLGRVLGKGRSQAAATIHASPAEQSQRTGVALLPGSTLDIVFRELPAAGSIRITLDAGPQAAVRAQGGTVRYAVAPGRVLIDNANAVASYEILIPRAVPRARVRIGDRVVFGKDGATIATDLPADSTGRYVVAFPMLKRSPP